MTCSTAAIIGRILTIAALTLSFPLSSTATKCERLKTSLTYTQEEAPRDLSGLLPVVVERINRLLEGVVDVEVEWTGADLHGRVGEHMVQCRVTRLAAAIDGGVVEEEATVDELGRNVVTQCFHVPFSILDTNECTLPPGHPMRHRCHESSVCVNTIGSYHCLCRGVDRDTPTGTADGNFWAALGLQERGPWEVSFNTTNRSSCPSLPSTSGCCPEDLFSSKEGTECRASFRCPVDPCSSRHDCAATATCIRAASPLHMEQYQCQCPPGLMGNGLKCKPTDPKPEPKVMFDGVTPTEETKKNNYYCDCTQPVIDACAGFPPCQGRHEVCTLSAGNIPSCQCKPGFVRHERYGCVDEQPPVLKLKNDPGRDQIIRLKQGDLYQEYAVEIQDENAEEYLRSLRIVYSEALPHSCLTRIGEFHVNYTIATPWTSPPFVRVTRRVVVEDIDECTLEIARYEQSCPELIPQCDVENGATCVNSIGSYSCKCPKYTVGDGFRPGLSFPTHRTPEGFQGGTSCRDTSKPVISLHGPNPKVFRVCECSGISGFTEKGAKRDDPDLRNLHQRHYDTDIRDLIRSTAGSELCATSTARNPRPGDCVRAYDDTYKGRVDLSRAVVVGEPIQKTALHWIVPYDVRDEAGNAADTVWRDVVVEEVDLATAEAAIRKELLQVKDKEIEAAVSRALDQHKRSRNREPAVPTTTCPKCPPCHCSGEVDATKCEAFCQAKLESCQFDAGSFVIRVMLWLEQFLPPALVAAGMLFSMIIVGLMFLRWVVGFLFSPYIPPLVYYTQGEREHALQNAVTYYNRDGAMSNFTSPPTRSLLRGDDIFLTPRVPTTGTTSAALQSPPPDAELLWQERPVENALDDIYADPPIITPSKHGDGVRRRSPYIGRDR